MFLYFILGILFIEIVIPIIEALVTLILTWIEVLKGKCSLNIAKMSAEITNISEPVEESSHNAIGFVISGDDEYEEEKEDD